MILDRERRYGPGVVSKIVPLEACEEIEVWWHHDEDGPAPAPHANPGAAPNAVPNGVASVVSAGAVVPARVVSGRVVSGGAALPLANPATPATTPRATLIRSAPFRSRRPP